MALKPTLSLTVLSNCPHCRGTSGRCRGSTVSDSSHSLGFPCTMASAAEETAGGAGGGGNLGLVPCPPQYLSQPGAQQLTRRWNRTLTMNVPPSVLQVDLMKPPVFWIQTQFGGPPPCSSNLTVPGKQAWGCLISDSQSGRDNPGCQLLKWLSSKNLP